MFQFPSASLWRDCRLRVACKSPRVEALFAVPVRLPRCVAGETWGLNLWIAYGETVTNFSNVPLCLKPKRGPWRARRPMCKCFHHFCAFHGSCCPNYTVGQPGRANYTATFAISMDTTWRRCCRHICEGDTLHWVHCRRSYAAITTLVKERIALSLILKVVRTGDLFGPSLPQTSCKSSQTKSWMKFPWAKCS